MASVAPGMAGGAAAGIGNITAGGVAATAMANAQAFWTLAVNGMVIANKLVDKIS